MAVLHRALITWFLCLVFLILLVIRLDQRTNWNWFIVFIPMWIFDVAVLTYAWFSIFSRCKNEPLEFCSAFITRKVQIVVVVMLKLALQVLLCLKLEYQLWNLPLYYVLIPFWILCAFVFVKLTQTLIETATQQQLNIFNKWCAALR